MATNFFTGIDLNGSQLLRARIENLATAPAGVTQEGRIYYDTALHQLFYRSDTGWVGMVDGVSRNLFDADTILKADTDNNPVALTVAPDTLVGRISSIDGGVITALTNTSVRNWLGTLDQFVPPVAPMDFNSQRLTNLATPTLPTDGATKAYVDASITGLEIKDSCRVTVGTNIDLSSPGATLDGVTMNAGDRVLVRGQTAGETNGIYDYNGPTSPMTRSTDADSDAEVVSGMYTLIREGTDNGKGYALNTPNPITVGTTPLSFVQFSGAGQGTGTPDRITVTGSQIDIASTYVGQASLTTLGTVTTGTWEATPIDIAHGGTGATTADQARINLGFVGKIAADVGDGTAVSFNITHPFGTKDVKIELYEVSTGSTVFADISRTADDTITIGGFDPGNPPTANQFRVVVIG